MSRHFCSTCRRKLRRFYIRSTRKTFPRYPPKTGLSKTPFILHCDTRDYCCSALLGRCQNLRGTIIEKFYSRTSSVRLGQGLHCSDLIEEAPHEVTGKICWPYTSLFYLFWGQLLTPYKRKARGTDLKPLPQHLHMKDARDVEGSGAPNFCEVHVAVGFSLVVYCDASCISFAALGSGMTPECRSLSLVSYLFWQCRYFHERCVAMIMQVWSCPFISIIGASLRHNRLGSRAQSAVHDRGSTSRSISSHRRLTDLALLPTQPRF